MINAIPTEPNGDKKEIYASIKMLSLRDKEKNTQTFATPAKCGIVDYGWSGGIL